MKIRFSLLAALALSVATPNLTRAASALDAAPTYVAPAATEVAQLVTVWHDDKRNRDVPAKVFYPQSDGPFPLLILSHGLGGSRDGLDYIGRFWASHGYVCAQIQHLGTDESVWRDAKNEQEAEAALKRAAGNLLNILARPRDVSFAIDQMLKLNAEENSELSGKINPNKIGVAGHSLGGLTALFSAGQKAVSGGFALDLSDPRIKASVAMSSPLNPAAPLNQQFASFKIPNFYLVGADDNAVLGATIAQRQIFDAIDAPDQFLLIIKGADHMALGGQRFGDALPGDAAAHALVQTATLTFWDAELKGKGAAKVWLKDDFAARLAEGNRFESK